jgi:hypothetical protein
VRPLARGEDGELRLAVEAGWYHEARPSSLAGGGGFLIMRRTWSAFLPLAEYSFFFFLFFVFYTRGRKNEKQEMRSTSLSQATIRVRAVAA